MYNVRNQCARMWYDRRNTIRDGRQIHENVTHTHVEKDPSINEQLKLVGEKVIRLNKGFVSNNHQINRASILNKRMMVIFDSSKKKFIAKFKNKMIQIEPTELLIYKFNEDDNSLIKRDYSIIADKFPIDVPVALLKRMQSMRIMNKEMKYNR